ncbi:UDP-Glycosyltransferase/glycogen phosphorylase [Setomelanomma holmii]|uniref:UDP-Glycosyltransferase/glycogen phosphorylase n=1 Tax=Setomelanomma holmii TaxID=210430 RepID=A0A9P4GZV9_9PLEO|nr:UDP-Glycosyltransferase/glycogen phosphorylase [Setomelanomma holmii]
MRPTSSKHRDHLHDSKSRTTGRVNTLGQIAVKFHHDPKRLERWFRHAQEDSAKAETTALERAKFARQKSRLPASRLNIAIHICGSRGDVQPFVPIAKLLQAPPHGHRVRICTHPAFKDFVEENGIEFFSIGGDPEALMAYMVKNPGLLPGMESIKAGDIAKRRKEMAEMFEDTWRSCIEAGDGMGKRLTAIDVDDNDDLFIADAIIANPPSMGHIHCAEKLGIPLHIVFTMPWSPTKAFHHPLAAMEYGELDTSVANYFSFAVMELLTWQGLGDLINRFRTRTLKLDPISPLWGFQLLQRLRVPHSYLWSQTLIPKPSDWSSHLNITGFSFLKLGSSYSPPEDLIAFLEKGPTPVYIGFGSIVVDDPARLTKLIFEAVNKAGVRAIVSKGWGGMGAGDVPENVYLIGNCPHDWLFQHVSCVVHHGGAGTTAAGIALGKPTVVVPFFGDQPFWGQMIARAGAGPKPIPYKQMTPDSLAASIRFALKDEVKEAVEGMAFQISQEDGAAGTVQDFEEALRVDELRCHVCPDRLAVWIDKESGAHLSGFATATLAAQGLVHPKQLRLLRHRHWYVHEGAESPGIGAIAAISGLFAGIGTDTTTYSERLKRRPTAEDQVLDGKASLEAGTADEPPERKVRRPKHLENMAWRMAVKTYEGNLYDNLDKPHTNPKIAKLHSRIAAKKAKHGRAYQLVSATGHYAGDLSRTGLKTPVAFLYNVANGFRNLPSYSIANEEHRRRDEITGLGSGFGVAGKEFVLGTYEAFSGLVRHPYVGAKTEGPAGFIKGIGRGYWAFSNHLLAAIFGLSGYSLKGIERALSKHRLTNLQAELYLIRLRQAIQDLDQSTAEEKADVVAGWKRLRKMDAQT